MIADHEYVVWNPALSLPAKEFEIPDAEAARIRTALHAWQSYAAGADRRWLQPLLEAMFPPDTRA
jgi:hypothetical protein